MRSQSDTGVVLTTTASADARDGHGVARNFLFLVAGQLATATLSFGVTAMLARHLGAERYGVLYLAAMLVDSAFVLADLGQQYYVVGRIARDRRAAATLLGNGLVLRLLGAIALYPLLAGLAAALGYPEATRLAISLTAVFFLACSVGDGVTIVLRGLERMDIEAVVQVASKALIAAGVAVAVIGDGGLPAVLVAQIVGALAALIVYGLALRHLHLGWPRLSLATAGSILSGGAPFLVWTVAITLQPGIDALLLSLLAPPSVIGWYAAASKLVGVLIFPATILGAALYPTLSRLQAQSAARHGELIQAALRVIILLAVLSAVGTYLFADTAVALVYGAQGFGPAASCLRVFAAYIFLVFVDITLGAAIMAASASTRWIVAKLVSLLVATGLSVVLIPLTQSVLGNGGIGCAAATVAAEVVMFLAALRLVPVDTVRLVVEVAKDLGRAAAAAVVMVVTAWMLRDGEALVGMALSAAAYLATISLLGAIGRADVRFVRDVVQSNFRM